MENSGNFRLYRGFCHTISAVDGTTFKFVCGPIQKFDEKSDVVVVTIYVNGLFWKDSGDIFEYAKFRELFTEFADKEMRNFLRVKRLLEDLETLH